MSRALLSLGSNQGDRYAYLRLAVEELGETVVLVSGVYETPPWGDDDQPAYLNAVVLAVDPAATRSSARQTVASRSARVSIRFTGSPATTSASRPASSP